MTALVMVLMSLCSFAATTNEEIPRLVSESYAGKENFKDLANEFRARGVPEADVLAIEAFIKAQGLPLSTELAKEKFSAKGISFGDQRLVWNESLQVKTGTGRFLKFDDKSKADDVFIQTYNALMKKETSAWRFVVPEAHAQTLQRVRESASAAGWNVLMFGTQLATTGAAVLLDGVGSIALLAERVKTAFANTTRGHVKCGPKGEYVVDGTYKYYDRKSVYEELIAIDTRLQNSYVAKDPNSYLSRSTTAVGRRMGTDAIAKLHSFTTMFTLDRNKDVYVSQAFLQKIWAPKPIQKCDPEYNAKIVEAVWKSSGNTMDEKVRNYQNDGYGPKYNYDYDDRGQPIQPGAAPARAKR